MKKLTKFDVGPIYLISYVLQLVLQTVVLTAFQARYGDAYKDRYSWTYAIVFVNGLSFLAAVLGYSAAKKIKFFSEVGIKKKPDAKMALLIVPIAVFTIFSTMPLANWFVELFGKLGYDVASSSITMPTDVFGYILMSLFLSLVPAVCEEIMFRGAIAVGLRRQGAAVAVLLSAAMFALMHGNPVQLVHQFGIGVVLAVVVLTSGDIKYAMAFHFLNNFISCIASLIFPSLNSIEFAAWQIPVGLAVMAVGLVSLTVAVTAFVRRSLEVNAGAIAEGGFKNLMKSVAVGFVGIFKKGGLRKVFDDINDVMRKVTPDMAQDGVDDEAYLYGKKCSPLLVLSLVLLVVMWILNTAMGF